MNQVTGQNYTIEFDKEMESTGTVTAFYIYIRDKLTEKIRDTKEKLKQMNIDNEKKDAYISKAKRKIRDLMKKK